MSMSNEHVVRDEEYVKGWVIFAVIGERRMEDKVDGDEWTYLSSMTFRSEACIKATCPEISNWVGRCSCFRQLSEKYFFSTLQRWLVSLEIEMIKLF